MNALIRTASLAMALGMAWAAAGAVLPLPGFAAPARAASKLGDLSSYRAIVVDAAALVDRGDLADAKPGSRTSKCPGTRRSRPLKPRAAAEWHTGDKSIDRALLAQHAGRCHLQNVLGGAAHGHGRHGRHGLNPGRTPGWETVGCRPKPPNVPAPSVSFADGIPPPLDSNEDTRP